MRAVTAVLMSALVVVLSVIAYDLHRVAGALQSTGALSAIVLSAGQAPKETREQRVRRQMQLQRDLDDEFTASLEASDRLDASRGKAAVKR